MNLEPGLLYKPKRISSSGGCIPGKLINQQACDVTRPGNWWDSISKRITPVSSEESSITTWNWTETAGDMSYGCIEGFNLTAINAREAFHEIQRYMVENTRLGIPVISVSESLHGSVHDGSTIFPQSLAVGSSFNTELAYRMTKSITYELKSQGIIQTLSPGLDVVRDLRWGCVGESFGAWLVGQIALHR